MKATDIEVAKLEYLGKPARPSAAPGDSWTRQGRRSPRVLTGWSGCVSEAHGQEAGPKWVNVARGHRWCYTLALSPLAPLRPEIFMSQSSYRPQILPRVSPQPPGLPKAITAGGHGLVVHLPTDGVAVLL